MAAQEASDQPQEEGPALVSPALDCVAVSLLLLARMLCVRNCVHAFLESVAVYSLLLRALTAVATLADGFSCFPDSTCLFLLVAMQEI